MPDDPLVPTPAPAESDDPNGEPLAPVGPVRTLTDDELVAYAASLGTLGYTFADQGLGNEAIGFRVSGHGATYDYRYDEGDTAVTLMDRIVAQLGG